MSCKKSGSSGRTGNKRAASLARNWSEHLQAEVERLAPCPLRPELSRSKLWTAASLQMQLPGSRVARVPSQRSQKLKMPAGLWADHPTRLAGAAKSAPPVTAALRTMQLQSSPCPNSPGARLPGAQQLAPAQQFVPALYTECCSKNVSKHIEPLSFAVSTLGFSFGTCFSASARCSCARACPPRPPPS